MFVPTQFLLYTAARRLQVIHRNLIGTIRPAGFSQFHVMAIRTTCMSGGDGGGGGACVFLGATHRHTPPQTRQRFNSWILLTSLWSEANHISMTAILPIYIYRYMYNERECTELHRGYGRGKDWQWPIRFVDSTHYWQIEKMRVARRWTGIIAVKSCYLRVNSHGDSGVGNAHINIFEGICFTISWEESAFLKCSSVMWLYLK